MKNMRLILSLALIAVIVVFSIQNAEELQVRFLFWSLTTRRVFVLFGVLAIGIILGWIMRAHVDTRSRNQAETLDP